MTINLWHCIIINFTSLALEGVYNRLSLFKVLTQSHMMHMGTCRTHNQQQIIQSGINNYHRLCKTMCRNATTDVH